MTHEIKITPSQIIIAHTDIKLLIRMNGIRSIPYREREGEREREKERKRERGVVASSVIILLTSLSLNPTRN